MLMLKIKFFKKYYFYIFLNKIFLKIIITEILNQLL